MLAALGLGRYKLEMRTPVCCLLYYWVPMSVPQIQNVPFGVVFGAEKNLLLTLGPKKVRKGFVEKEMTGVV